MKRKWFPVMLAALAVTLILAGCGSGGSNAPASSPAPSQSQAPSDGPQPSETPKPPVKVSLALLKFTSNAPLFIAHKKGFFEEENIDIEIQWFDAANPANVAVASNNVDVAGAGLTADLYNMIAAGQAMKLVSDKGREEEGYHNSGLVVGADSGIQSFDQLKGKKIGITTIGSTQHYAIAKMLEKHGIAANEVEWTPLNTVSAVSEALKGKHIEAAYMNEPNVTIAVTQGFAKVLAWTSDEIDFQTAGIVFSPKFSQNREAGVQFLKAYLRGAQYYYDAVLQRNSAGELIKGGNYDEVLDILVEYTGQKREVLEQSFSFIDPQGKLDLENVKAQIQWYHDQGLIRSVLDVGQFVDTSMIEEALNQL